MTDSLIPKQATCTPLAAWLESSKNVELSMDDKHALRVQTRWVDQSLRHMVFRALVSRTDPRMVDPDEFLTVDGSYYVGELELPIYRFDMNGVTIKLRHDARDWCVRIWGTAPLLISSYLVEALMDGDYSVMGDTEVAPSGEFCAGCPEHVYAVLWDALTAHREAVEAGHAGTLEEMAEEVRTEGSAKSEEERTELEQSFHQRLHDNNDNHYIVTGRFECSDDNTRYVLAPTAMEAEDKFRKWMVAEDPDQEDGAEAVIVALVVQIPGPPIAIYADDVEENPQPLK
jgi:hypothetical protein